MLYHIILYIKCWIISTMKFCPCCKLMSSEALVPCSICGKSVCFTPCRTRCKLCWRLVCTDDMTECSNCNKSICATCNRMWPDMWRDRPECCYDVLPPLCKSCPEDHKTQTCDFCGMEGCCEEYMNECHCGKCSCHDCTNLYVDSLSCMHCSK